MIDIYISCIYISLRNCPTLLSSPTFPFPIIRNSSFFNLPSPIPSSSRFFVLRRSHLLSSLYEFVCMSLSIRLYRSAYLPSILSSASCTTSFSFPSIPYSLSSEFGIFLIFVFYVLFLFFFVFLAFSIHSYSSLHTYISLSFFCSADLLIFACFYPILFVYLPVSFVYIISFHCTSSGYHKYPYFISFRLSYLPFRKTVFALLLDKRWLLIITFCPFYLSSLFVF